MRQCAQATDQRQRGKPSRWQLCSPKNRILIYMLSSPSTNPAWRTLLPPFHSCRNRPCVKPNRSWYLGPSGRGGEMWGRVTGIEAQGGIALIASAEGRETLILSLQRAFQAQGTGSLPWVLSTALEQWRDPAPLSPPTCQPKLLPTSSSYCFLW